MTQQHTPGPWEIDDGRYIVGRTCGGRYTICGCWGGTPGDVIDETQARANARLIAAAPALLAALDEIEAMHDSRNIHEARERARSAIAAARAKGGAA